jgi:hypothetical protein
VRNIWRNSSNGFVRAAIAKYLIQSFRAAIDPERERAPEHLLMVYQPEELPAVADIRRL